MSKTSLMTYIQIYTQKHKESGRKYFNHYALSGQVPKHTGKFWTKADGVRASAKTMLMQA